MSIRTRLVCAFSVFATKSVGTVVASVAPNPLALAIDPASDPVVFDWANGTAVGQASKAIAIEQTVNANGFVSIDLTTQVDRFGDAVAFTKVKAFFLHVTAVGGTGATLSINGTFNPYKRGSDADVTGLVVGDVVTSIRPAGMTIDGTNKVLGLAASAAGTVTARVIIVGD